MPPDLTRADQCDLSSCHLTKILEFGLAKEGRLSRSFFALSDDAFKSPAAQPKPRNPKGIATCFRSSGS